MWQAISSPTHLICFLPGTVRRGCCVRKLFLNRQEVGLNDPRALSSFTSSSLCSPYSMFSLLGLQCGRQAQTSDPKIFLKREDRRWSLWCQCWLVPGNVLSLVEDYLLPTYSYLKKGTMATHMCSGCLCDLPPRLVNVMEYSWRRSVPRTSYLVSWGLANPAIVSRWPTGMYKAHINIYWMKHVHIKFVGHWG